ncbi:MAG: hypothetical protein JXX14_02270 [Deltaproteobacteria bacterium]|nr:hypothetical protein [Deltaproteobacteria bacterium]
MPELINKVRNYFFAIMVPGAFVTLLLALGILSGVEVSQGSAFIFNWNFWDKLNNGWIIPAVFLTMSFMVGNGFWAVKINDTDTKSVKRFLNDNHVMNCWRLAERIDSFPYPMVLIMTQQHMKTAYGSPSYLPELPNMTQWANRLKDDAYQNKYREIAKPGSLWKWIWRKRNFEKLREQDRANCVNCFEETTLLHTCFNYWKNVLLEKASNSYLHVQEHENRVRLFAGMYLAGGWGLGISFAGWTLGVISIFANGYQISFGVVAFSVALLTSALICRSYGGRLRRIRVHEVVETYIAYATFKHYEHASAVNKNAMAFRKRKGCIV